MDTLGIDAYRSAQKVLYKDQLGGYAVGTNYYQDLAKAQEFTVGSRKSISKILFCFGAKKHVAPDSISYLMINIYALNDSGTSTSSSSRLCPGSILHSRKLLLDSIDTIAGHFTSVKFDWVLSDSVNTNFAVGFDMSYLSALDSVGLYSTKDSSANKTQKAWEKQSNGNWFTMLKTWPLDIDLAIFPIVDTVFVGLSDLEKEKTQFQLNPNPANQNIKLSLKTLENANFNIFNILGEQVYSLSISNQLDTYQIDTSNLPNGFYSCILSSNKGIFKKKIQVIHN